MLDVTSVYPRQLGVGVIVGVKVIVGVMVKVEVNVELEPPVGEEGLLPPPELEQAKGNRVENIASNKSPKPIRSFTHTSPTFKENKL